MSFFAVILVLKDSFTMDFSFNSQGFIFFISMFEPYKILLTATFIIIPVYIALESLISNINNQEGKALLDFRALLNETDNLDIHKKLRGDSGIWANGIPKEEKDNKDIWRKIDNYLGILEMLNILIDKNVISQENFNNQFGYRVDNVFNNVSITKYINEYGNNGKTIWKQLFSLFEKRNLNCKKFNPSKNPS